MYSSPAIVIKKIPFGEADALVTLYTKEFGKIRALAQGVKKEQAKLKGHVEPLSFSLAHFVLGRYGERLTSAFLLKSWSGILGNLEKRMQAHALVEMVDRACFDRMRDDRMWEFLCGTLAELDQEDAVLPQKEFLREVEKGITKIVG